MNIAEIEAAVDAGKSVHWANEGYVVHKDDRDQYLITYLPNGSTIGLTNRAGGRLNGDEVEFFISRPDLGLRILCSACGSEDVMRDCWATWNAELQLWESADLQDHAWCNNCDGETKLVERAIRDFGGAAGNLGCGAVNNEPHAASEQGRAARVATENTNSNDGSG